MSDDYDYKPLPQPTCLEKVVVFVFAIISAILWRKR